MPQMKVETRYCSEPRKNYDAPETNRVTCEIRDESSPESSPPLNGFLQKGQLLKSDLCQDTYRSKKKDKVLSVLSKNRTPKKTTLSDLDLHPSYIVNGHCSNDADSNGDINGSLFDDSLLSSLTCKSNKDNMKVINGCKGFGNFSDLLSSICLPDHRSKEDSKRNFEIFNGHSVNDELSKSTSSYSDEQNNSSSTLSSISSTEPYVSKQNRQNSSTKQQKNEINDRLLDILPSISYDETDNSHQNGCTSSSISSHNQYKIKSSDSNELILDFPSLNSHTLNSSSDSTPAELQNNGSLSDMLSSITFPENNKSNENKSTDFANQNLGNDSLFNLQELSSEFLGSKNCIPKDKCFSFTAKLNDAPDNDIDGLLYSSSAVDTPKTTDPVNSFTKDEKTDFSFFSVSPDNVFSSMLSNLHTHSNQQDKNTNENTDNISMLDLLKSVNTDSSSSFLEYLDVPHQTEEINTVPGDLSEILDIDLSTCIKTSEDTDALCRDLPVNNICTDDDDTAHVKIEEYMKPVFNEIDSNRPRINRSQSLFAKALSCRPKRNPELVKKAFYVKSELCKLYFNRELPGNAELDKDFKMKEDVYTNNEMVVCKTNTCMITFKGRRFCPHEVN